MINKTLIIGQRSYLSHALYRTLYNPYLIASDQILNDKTILKRLSGDASITIIINSFYPVNKLDHHHEPHDYITQSIYLLSLLLEQCKRLAPQINKMIYTSSASVYGNNRCCKEEDIPNPTNLYASIKLSCEKLMESFCETFGIDYTSIRLFNMYSDQDPFSIISKILHTVKENQTLSLINEGKSVRDFIHINDVVRSYKQLISFKAIPLINLAVGEGISIEMILNHLANKGYPIITDTVTKDEIDVSIANVGKLSQYVDVTSFIPLFDFIDVQLEKH